MLINYFDIRIHDHLSFAENIYQLDLDIIFGHGLTDIASLIPLCLFKMQHLNNSPVLVFAISCSKSSQTEVLRSRSEE